MNRVTSRLIKLSLRKERMSFKALPAGMKRIYSFLVLVAICVVFSVGSVLIGLYDIHVNNERFCDVLNASTSVPAVKPTNPATQPVTDETYQRYLRHLKLERSLGC